MARRLHALVPLALGLTLSAVSAGLALPQAPPAGTAPPAGSSAVPAAATAATGAAAASTPAPAEPAFPVEEYTLSNGLRVVLAPDRTLPSVAVRVTYHVGRRDEPPGLEGIAHLTEHLMFMCSSHVPRGKLFRILGDAGAIDVNGETGLDRTFYHETVPPERLELALWLESDRMGYFAPAVDEQALEHEKRVVKNELRTRHLDVPGGLATALLFDATFPAWHPYHTSFSSELEALNRITLADVKAFAGTWVGPANATLVLAGRFEPDEVRRLVERYFATLPGRPPPARPPLPPLERKGPTTIDIGANLDSELLWLTWVTPAAGSAKDTALDRVSSILTSGDTSRLERSIVGTGLAQVVSTGQLSMATSSVFTLRALAGKGRSAEDVLAAIDRELDELGASGPTGAEIQRVQSSWAVAGMFQLESAGGRASLLDVAAGHGPLELPLDWLKGYRRTFTAAELQDAARLLSPARRAAVIIGRFRAGAPVGGVVVRREEP